MTHQSASRREMLFKFFRRACNVVFIARIHQDENACLLVDILSLMTHVSIPEVKQQESPRSGVFHTSKQVHHLLFSDVKVKEVVVVNLSSPCSSLSVLNYKLKDALRTHAIARA